MVKLLNCCIAELLNCKQDLLLWSLFKKKQSL